MSKQTEKTTLSGQATQEQIEQWKQKHGEIFQVVVEDKVCYLRKPTRAIISATTAVASQSGGIKSNEVLLNSCWLGGDEAIKTDDAYFFGASQQLAGIMEIKSSELKKL